MASKSLPCPRCGNPETIGTFCTDCLRALHPLVKEIKPAKVTFCSHCGAAKIAGVWKAIPTSDAVAKACQPSLVFAADAEITQIETADPDPELVIKPGVHKTTSVLAVVTGHQEDASEDYEEEYDIPLHYDVTYCPRCAKEGTRYYEGILQVRNETPAISADIHDYLRKHAPKGLRLAKHIPIGTGADYYLSDHRAIGHLAKRLHGQFGGELKINAQHFSEDAQAGKILYRVNAFLEVPEYGKGDVILRQGKYLYILGVNKKVKAEELETGTEMTFPYVRGETERLPVRNTQVTVVDPVEVLHPETYESVVPTNSKYAPAELEVDRKVSVAYDRRHLFLIPDTTERLIPKPIKKRMGQKVSKKD